MDDGLVPFFWLAFTVAAALAVCMWEPRRTKLTHAEIKAALRRRKGVAQNASN